MPDTPESGETGIGAIPEIGPGVRQALSHAVLACKVAHSPSDKPDDKPMRFDLSWRALHLFANYYLRYLPVEAEERWHVSENEDGGFLLCGPAFALAVEDAKDAQDVANLINKLRAQRDPEPIPPPPPEAGASEVVTIVAQLEGMLSQGSSACDPAVVDALLMKCRDVLCSRTPSPPAAEAVEALRGSARKVLEQYRSYVSRNHIQPDDWFPEMRTMEEALSRLEPQGGDTP